MSYLICVFAVYGAAAFGGPLLATALVRYGKWREARWLARLPRDLQTEEAEQDWESWETIKATAILLTVDDYACIEALIRETGCTPGRDE